MGYNVIDLINKAIDISIRKKAIYEHIGQRKCDIPSMEMVSTILIKQINNTIRYYETLKKKAEDKAFEEIDISIYDRISFLINEFNKKMHEPQINNIRDFLEFSLISEKDTYSLFIDIQGRFVKNTSDIHTETYNILSDMINNKVEFITTLEKIIK
jgi:wyosine [tRNA(Phe)-imidazoG37] synthetase (radical SAM superfamily)